jgi:hypothetical protein
VERLKEGDSRTYKAIMHLIKMTLTKVRSNSVRGRKNQNPNKPIKKDLSYVMVTQGKKKQTLRNSREHH